MNDTEVKINSVKKILKECSFEYEGECISYTEPDNDFFILVDLTIKNKGEEELDISSIMAFDLKDEIGEKGKYALLLKSINSQLDGSVMSNDLLKGQIAYGVNESDKYYFYYKDSVFDDTIKFVINDSDITE